jgi:hypothetical protein
VKYRAVNVTAQLATTLCARSVPTIKLTQNRAVRTRSMGIPFFCEVRGHRNAPVDFHEGRAAQKRATKLKF